MKRSPLTITIAVVLIVVFGLMLFVFQVRKSEVAVVTLFGKMERVKDQPGPSFKWPWPIERVYTLDQRVQNFEDKLDQATLPDNNIILLQTYVGWRIDNPTNFFPKFRGGSIAEAQSTLEGLVRSAKLEVAGQHVFSDFVSATQNQSGFSKIEDEMLQKVQREVRAGNYGIEVKFVQIKNIGLPQTVTQSVFDRMKSERGTHTAEITADAQLRASIVKADADAQATTIKAQGEARAKEIRGEAEAEMVQSLQILQQNPPLADFIMSLDALQELTKDKTTWILDHTTPGLELLQNPKAAPDTNAASAHN